MQRKVQFDDEAKEEIPPPADAAADEEDSDVDDEPEGGLQRRAQSASTVRLGFDHLDYSTESEARSRSVVRAGPQPVAQLAMGKNVLRQTNFSMGNERGQWERSNAMRDPTGRVHEYTACLNEEAKATLLKSSIQFGVETGEMASTARGEMKWTVREPSEMQARRDEVVRIKKQLRSNNFEYGNQTLDYKTSQKEGFQPPKPTVRARPLGSSSELRRAHYQLGFDATPYERSNDMPQPDYDSICAASKHRESKMGGNPTAVSNFTLNDFTGTPFGGQ